MDKGLDVQKLKDALTWAFQQITGAPPPEWVWNAVAWLVVIGIAIGIPVLVLATLCKGKTLVVDHLLPLFHSREKRRRVARRQRLANALWHQLVRLNLDEDWRDHQFADLEAEVEAETGRRESLRREPSLSRALARSKQRHMLLEGDPGSGKSVALRHVALKAAERAAKSRLVKSVIPVYVNLRQLRRSHGKPVDARLIEDFVLRQLNRGRDRDIDDILAEELPASVADGTCLFLFDSFDETPEILSSTDVDDTIRSYSDAIAAFMAARGCCCCVLASREYRGPRYLEWATVRIEPLSRTRQAELVGKADLKPADEARLIRALQSPEHGLGQMVRNPMFLALLCGQVAQGAPVATSGQEAMERFVSQRLARDRERVEELFVVNIGEARQAAEAAAFAIAATEELGLQPGRDRLLAAVARSGFELGEGAERCLDALEYMKLARGERDPEGGSPRFSFAHRRFQEYFATCVLAAEPHRVPPERLLIDGRWREAAVTLLRTQPTDLISPLLDAASNLVSRAAETVAPAQAEADADALTSDVTRFPWPQGVRHVLALLQDGLRERPGDMPSGLRAAASRILSSVGTHGALLDRKWALEVSGTADQATQEDLLEAAFQSDSSVLKGVAFRQAGHLLRLTDAVRAGIFASVRRLIDAGRFYRERGSTEAYLSRLAEPAPFTFALALGSAVPLVDFLLHACLASLLVVLSEGNWISMGLCAKAMGWLALSHGSLVAWYFLTRDSLVTRFALGVCYVRAWLPLFVVAGLLGRLGSASAWVTTVAAVYVAGWAPQALAAIGTGSLVRPSLWWALPFRPLVVPGIIGRARSGLRGLLALFRDGWKVFASVVLVIAAVVGAVWGITLIIGRQALIAAGEVAFGVLVVLRLVRAAREAFRANTWRRRGTQHRAVGHLLDELAQFSEEGRILDLVREARTEERLPTSRQTAEDLEAVALMMENWEANGAPARKHTPRTDLERSALALWRHVDNLGAQFVDAMWLWVERAERALE